MLKFKATRLCAFLTGFVLGLAGVALDKAGKRALVSFTFESPRVFPFVIVYFLVTGLLFVIGPQTWSGASLAVPPALVGQLQTSSLAI
jgi:hypothetical protein